MAEIAGLAIGVASLAFELFSGCLKGYNLILTAKDMPKESSFLLVRMQMEKEKLIGWALLSGLSEDEKSCTPSLRLNRHTVTDALREMQVILLDFVNLRKQYRLELVAANQGADTDADDSRLPHILPGRHANLERAATRLFDATRKYPKRLRWAAFDKKRFEDLLANITALNAGMMHFLESNDRERHLRMQEVTFVQILQVHNRIDDLFNLLKSLKDPTISYHHSTLQQEVIQREHTTGSPDAHQYEERAIRLTRFKATSLTIEADKDTKNGSSQDPKLPLTELILKPEGSGGANQRSCGTFASFPVWVEWREYIPVMNDDASDTGVDENAPPAFVEDRLSKMAKLLRGAEKPPEFRAPDCLGYVHDPRVCRLGLVFRGATDVQEATPTSLLAALSTNKPSLTARIRMSSAIASSIWYLHSTNWLHKGLRSDNIVFPSQIALNTLTPVLCGFDYSRPADLDETTERPSENPWHNLYRHPSTQFDVPREGKRGFRKLYDIYSIGVVLYEIGMWSPISEVLGIDLSQRLRASTIKSVQGVLLSSRGMSDLEADCGNVYATVVKACLSGDFHVGQQVEADLDDSALQVAFWENVIEKLESIVV